MQISGFLIYRGFYADCAHKNAEEKYMRNLFIVYEIYLR